DAREFKKLGLSKDQLVVLVHSGSRGLGETILQSSVHQNSSAGLKADSPAGKNYLRDHDFAVRWAKANRELIARRFATALGAEAKCLWDGCHNSITLSPPASAPFSHRKGEGGGKRLWVHRKGAVTGESSCLVIPGSRGSLAYLVKPLAEGERYAWSLAH